MIVYDIYSILIGIFETNYDRNIMDTLSGVSLSW